MLRVSRRSVRTGLISGMVLILVSGTGCGGRSKKPVIEENPIEFRKEGVLSVVKAADGIRHEFDIEIADNEYEIQTGLMYREHMEDRQGMLFVFEDEAFRSFYMKNTEIPLDILFVASDSTIVSIQKNAQPLDETSLPSKAPARFVFEINGGLSDRLGLATGDRIEFQRY